MNNLTSTIAAISTPPGKGGVALIRISGDEAIEVAQRCFLPKSKRPLSSYESRVSVYGDVIFEGKKIDDAMATVFRAPQSYTGENTVEISCHGGMLISHTVLCAVLASGAVAASAGEFTKRAFLSGKLSLSDAEAIGMLLEAKTHSQILLNSSSSRSSLSRKTDQLHSELISLLSSMYAKIDYPEEDLADVTPEQLQTKLYNIQDQIDALCASYKTGKAINEGIATVICGKPNVGKSTLYNMLCGGNYAIVSEYEGTTRDVLEKTVSLGVVTLNLCDTAGIRDTDAPIEQIGIELSREKISSSELIFAVFDCSRPLDEYDMSLIEQLRDVQSTVIAVINKTDLENAIDTSVIESNFEHTVKLCAKQSADELCRIVERLFCDESLCIGTDAVVANARQHASLLQTKEYIRSALEALAADMPYDIVSSDMESAASAISELDGRAVSEDVVAGIFHNFCVGK